MARTTSSVLDTENDVLDIENVHDALLDVGDLVVDVEDVVLEIEDLVAVTEPCLSYGLFAMADLRCGPKRLQTTVCRVSIYVLHCL